MVAFPVVRIKNVRLLRSLQRKRRVPSIDSWSNIFFSEIMYLWQEAVD